MNTLQYGAMKMLIVTLVTIIGISLAAPNVLPESARSYLPGWMKPMELGLDLREAPISCLRSIPPRSPRSS